MVNRVQQFLSEVFGEVRAFEKGGQIWFVAQDVANVLGYSLTTDMTRGLEQDEKDMQTLHTLGGNQEMLIINESGLYSIVLSITKRNKERYEKAREFKRWICGTVIPALRKDGAYIQDEEKVSNNEMSEDEFVLKAMTILQSKVERLTKERDRYSRFIGDKMSKVTKKELAQRLNCTPQRLAKILKEQEIYTPVTNEISQWFLDLNKDVNITVNDNVDIKAANGKEIHKSGWQYTGEGAIRIVKFLEENELVKYSDNEGFVLLK